MFSAYFTLALVALQYLVDHHVLRNCVDRAFLTLTVPKSMTIKTQEGAEKWNKAFDAAVLFLGDTQVVTSVAILLAGYIQLPCGLSAYHWEMIVDLAWFSALTHLTALTSLRYYFRQRPGMAIWRATFMGVTLLLLATALQPTGYIPVTYLSLDQYGNPDQLNETPARFAKLISSPAMCLWNEQRRAELGQSLSFFNDPSLPQTGNRLVFNASLITMSLVYFSISYITRVIRISSRASAVAASWLQIVPMRRMCQLYDSAKLCPYRYRTVARLWKGALLVCITLFEAFYEIGNSMLWEILWLAAALVWGTLRLVQHRYHSSLAGENTWGFGQVLALILSILPLWSFFSTLQETVRAPLAIDTDIRAASVVDGLGQLHHHYWFNGLIGFMLGTALTLAGGTLYVFAGSTLQAQDFFMGSDTLYFYSRKTVVVYTIAFASSILAFAIFITLALAFHYRLLRSAWLSTRFQRLTARLTSVARDRLRVWSWIAFILLLLTLQLGIYLLIFYWSDVPYVYCPSGIDCGSVRDTE